jgi:hypothetical protein
MIETHWLAVIGVQGMSTLDRARSKKTGAGRRNTAEAGDIAPVKKKPDESKSQMIRILSGDKDYLQGLAEERGDTMLKVFHHLVEEHKVRSFIEGMQSDFAALARDQAVLKEEHEENLLLDGASFDALEDE